MKKCILNLGDLGIEKRHQSVFFATHSSIVYKEGMSINHDACSGDLLNKVSLPVDFYNYEHIDLGDAILLVFAGKDVLILDKQGHEPIQYALDIQRVGRCITKPFGCSSPNQIVFGTKFLDRVQFVNFDFIEQQRVSQTSSWDVDSATDCVVEGDMLYAILDNSLIVCCDMTTGETLWTKFEAGHVRPNVLHYNGKALYACQNTLKMATAKNIIPIRIPLVKVHSLQQILGNKLYFTSNEGKNLCCFDLLKKRLEWEIPGQSEIRESMLVQGLYEGTLYDIILLRMASHLGIVNVSIGKAVHFRKMPNLRRIRQTEDHVLLDKGPAETEMIPSHVE